MPRLLGVDIPNDRPTVVALTYLYGVGPKTARELCHKAGIDPHVRARDFARTNWAGWRRCWTRTTWSKVSCGGRSTRTSPAARHRLLPRACGIAAACRSAASGRGPTPALARARRRRWPARRASRTCGSATCRAAIGRMHREPSRIKHDDSALGVYASGGQSRNDARRVAT